MMREKVTGEIPNVVNGLATATTTSVIKAPPTNKDVLNLLQVASNALRTSLNTYPLTGPIKYVEGSCKISLAQFESMLISKKMDIVDSIVSDIHKKVCVVLHIGEDLYLICLVDGLSVTTVTMFVVDGGKLGWSPAIFGQIFEEGRDWSRVQFYNKLLGGVQQVYSYNPVTKGWDKLGAAMIQTYLDRKSSEKANAKKQMGV